MLTKLFTINSMDSMESTNNLLKMDNKLAGTRDHDLFAKCNFILSFAENLNLLHLNGLPNSN